MVTQSNFLQKHRIFVEGKADQAFIRDILNIFYGFCLTPNQIKDTIIAINGKDRISNFVNTFLEVDTIKRSGGNNIVIFDADYIRNEGGVSARAAWLEQLKLSLSIKFDYFLFTDIGGSEGTIESLLETCIHPEHAGIFDCWGTFEGCLGQLPVKYTLPAKKSKLYLYLECLYKETKAEKEKIKDPNRNFTENDKWLFDIEGNNNLRQLKEFLDKNLA